MMLIALASLAGMANVTAQAPQETPQQAKNREFIMKNYPPGARQRGEQGKVSFTVTIEPDGSLAECAVTESSGFAGLDNETCEIMVRYGQLKPVIGADGRGIRAKQNGFIVWRLPADTQVAAATPAAIPATMEKPDEIVCKKSQKTGSLIASTKQCMTRKDWALQERFHRDEVERIQGRGVGEEGN